MVSVNSLKRPKVTVDIDNDDDESESPANSVESSDAELSSDGELESLSKAEEENESGSEGDDEGIDANEGWADSLAKILKTNKPKNKKTLVLSKAKKHKEILVVDKGEKASFEIDGEIKEEKPSVEELKIKSEDGEPKSKRRKEMKTIKVKPNILEKDRERTLSKIATKGVVQLFNAVRNQQKTIEQQIEEAGPSEHRKEKIMKSFDKRTFLDVLMGESKSVNVESQCKPELKEETPKWNALRDDFMMGATMKDWDKQVPEDE